VVPSASAVTTPVSETLTMLGSRTDQVTGAPAMTAPDASCTCTCNGRLALRASVGDCGLITIAATDVLDAVGSVLLHDRLASARAAMANCWMIFIALLLASLHRRHPPGRST
jgi:hypothetical protein